MGFRSALLLEKASGEEFRSVAQIPQDGSIECALPANGFLHNRFRFYARPLPLTPARFRDVAAMGSRAKTAARA